MRGCEVAFITDKQRRPAEYWWDQMCSGHLTLTTFLKRVKRANWAARRDQYWSEVTQEILRQSKYRAVHDRLNDLREIQQLRSDALEAITPTIVDGRKKYPVAPSSLEGMIRAFAVLDQLADGKRDTILTMIEPELARDVNAEKTTAFSPDEMRRVARTLLESRQREQLRVGLLEENNGSEENSEETDIKGDKETGEKEGPDS